MKSSLIAALLALAVAIPGLAQPAASHATYRDDPIVRDLKAGKLTVREARLLQEQRAARQQQALAKPRPAPPVPKKAKAPVKKRTVAQAGKKKPAKHKLAGNRHADKRGNQHRRNHSQSHKAVHPVSAHHQTAVHKKRPPTH